MTDTIIIVRRGLMESIIQDAVTVAATFALILPGFMIGSAFLQFIGAALLMFLAVSFYLRYYRHTQLTLPQAKAKIDAMIAAEGKK